VWFAFAQGGWVVAVYSLLTFCYSGEAAILPAAVTDLFGVQNAGVNYGFAALGMSVGSIGFPLLARCIAVPWGRHGLAVGAAVLGAVCVWALRPTQGKRL
jgi:OFA family oxalate/formate antiporter-like MFS transporter